MEELKKLVIAYIAKTQGKTPEEVSSLLFKKNDADNTEVLNTNALDGLFEWNKNLVAAQTQKFETEKKELYDKGFKLAQATSLSKFEKDLRDQFKITEEKQGVELVQAILDKQAKESSTGEPTEDQVKRSKVYLDTIDALKKEKSELEKEWKDKYEGREKQLAKAETFKEISDDALKYLDTLNPVLPENESLAKEWKNIFLNRIGEFEFEKKDGKTIVLVKQDDGSTKALLDDHGHPVQFENMLKQKASSLFTFKEGEQRKGTGNNNDDDNGDNKGYKGPKPKNDAEYEKLLSEAKDEDTKIQITQAYLSK